MVLSCLALLLTAALTRALAEEPTGPGPVAPQRGPERVRPIHPASGAVVGARPLFRFEVSAPAGWQTATPPVVELSRDHWRTVERDYAAGRPAGRGWVLEERPGTTEGSFRCPEDLPDGDWEWRVRLERASAGAATAGVPFRVDATPPAGVEGLTVRRQPDGSLALSWRAVVEDIEGRPESVDRYAIYRYEILGTFPQGAPMRLAEVRSTSFTDRKPPSRSGARPALYYKVVAVDAAGNELGARGSAGE